MTIEQRKIDVLNNGYVRLLDVMGDDLSVVNNARASYDRQSSELDDKDKRLIAFLAREGHLAPFRHPRLQMEVYAPLVIARQWWRYAIDSAHIEDGTPWSESSRRYITEKTEFYVPQADEWRSKPANSKQGSGAPISEFTGARFTREMMGYIEEGEALYEEAMDAGIAPEQARLFLPAYGLMVRWRYTSSLQAVCHMLNQRLASDSQYEFQQYAKAVLELAREHFPISIEALVNEPGVPANAQD